MLIVPTEKRLDWQHAPVVLLGIVLLNVLVFFFYQSGDTEKFYNALEIYQENEFLEKEWPYYQEWVTSSGNESKLEALEDLRAQYDIGMYDEIEPIILLDLDFYDYLEQNARTFFADEFLSTWQRERRAAYSEMESISAFSGGLIANRLKIPSLLTHQFLHGDMMHLLGNMFFLVICGFAVEAALGHLKFFIFYLVGGVAAGFAQMAVDFSSGTPLIGASGAISGVMAMYLGIFRLKRIEFFYWFLFIVGYIRAPALLILPFYIGMEIYNYYSNPESGVAFMAHAGGFIAGAGLILGALLINPRILNEEYIEADQDVDPQREKLANVYSAIENFRFEAAYKHLKEIIDEQGINFELALLRFNIFKLSRSKAYLKCLIELFQLNSLKPHEVDKLELLWLDNPQVSKHMSEEQLLRLGMRLASLPDHETAKTIYQQVLESGFQHKDVDLLGEKIKYAAQRKND